MKISKVILESENQEQISIVDQKSVNIDDLNTSSKVAEYLRSEGLNIIPIVPGTKVPPKGFVLSSYFDKMCDVPITDNDSIAILHGKISNTYGMDVDMKNGTGVEDAIHVIAADIEKILSATMVVKTPKQGCHFIVEPIGDLPPKNAKYINKDGTIGIDIKTQGGYTLLPPSIHPEKEFGRYQFISKTLKRNPTSWSEFEIYLAGKGFFLKEDIENKDLHNDYNLDKLLRGKFSRGTRRRSLNSLYIKLRVRRWSEKHCTDKIIEINRKLPEPLDEKELENNIKYSESFFTNQVQPSLDDYNPEKGKTKKKRDEKFNAYVAVEQLKEDYEFISHISDEIYYYSKGAYHSHGKKIISKKCRQYWDMLTIDTTMINEITNIIRDTTTVIPENINEDIFDQDYKKITVKNGTFDFDKMIFGAHDSKLLTTIKHPIYYDSEKKCPKFHKFLNSCFAGDEIRITQVWEMMALCFIKKYIIQKGFVNYGIGSNGKSTFLAILRNMLGIQYTSSIPMQQFQKSQFIGYEIHGKCANISADGGTEPITKTGFIKGTLGGDPVRCEQKFCSPFDYITFITMIFTFNELPIVTDASDGFARKIQTIHWDQQFYGKDKDRTVDNLPYDTDERSGIFNKLIPIIKRLIDTRQLSFESTVEDTKKVWLSRSDSFYKFKSERIVFGADYKIDGTLLKSEYHKFCNMEGMTPVGGNLFSTRLSEMLDGAKPRKSRIDGKPSYVWYGFTLDSELREDGQSGVQDK